jgi:arylformamidase
LTPASWTVALAGTLRAMKIGRLVDLSHTIVPGEGSRPFTATMVPPPELQGRFDPDQWYVMHEVAFLNHNRTHIEAPYHVVKTGNDVAQVPLEQLCGTSAVLDLSHLAPGEAVAVEHVRAAAEPAGGVREGDVVLCRFDVYRWADQSPRPRNPHFTAEAIAWLVERGMKLMGVDLGGIELRGEDPRARLQYNHHQLMDRGIPLIENVANLHRLTQPRVTVFCFPVAIQGMDSFPVRLVAMEE